MNFVKNSQFKIIKIFIDLKRRTASDLKRRTASEVS